MQTLNLYIHRYVLLLLFIIVSPHALSSQEDPILMGSETFKEKCASCHGEDAKGMNAADIGLDINPPDLSMISKRNNGQFPVSRMYAIIDGREVVKDHGTRAMPTWGSLFLTDTIWEGCSQVDEQIVRGRILELILYLDSIQK
jgi:hypothetical protein